MNLEALFYPSLLDGKTLVVLCGVERGSEAIARGVLRAFGESVWIDTHNGAFPISKIDLLHLEPVNKSNAIPACQGFEFFTVRK